jgi:signal transduction histidine kinase
LVAVGLLQIPYVLESASSPTLFTIGYYWEGVVYLCTLALILTFPSGRLHLVPEGLLFLFALLVPQGLSTLSTALSSVASPGGTISACRTSCPTNLLVLREDPSLALSLLPYVRWATIILASATAALLIWRALSGSPPRRRAFAIGTPIALIFLLAQVLNQLARMYGNPTGAFVNDVRWLIVGARSLIWYGFLFALIAAELFAGAVLRTIVGESLRRPSIDKLEALLRGPLGDPELRLAFWRPRDERWIDAHGVVVESPPAGSGRVLTEVERDGRRTAAIVHDAQLADDPELLQAAGATALLALENAELQSAWTDSLRELSDSRARLATAADEERRHLERDLHDGVLQRLLAVRMRIRLTADVSPDPAVQAQLHQLEDQLGDALAELRDLAHGIYPSVLAESGLGLALEEVVGLAGRTVTLIVEDLTRYSPEVESAVYYSCREALQNALKHSGVTSEITVQLLDDDRDLSFEVRDNGVGFAETAKPGAGIRNVHDRIAALGGVVEVTSKPGHGTSIAGRIPLQRFSAEAAEAAKQRHLSALN